MVIDKDTIEEIKQSLNKFSRKAYEDDLSDGQWTIGVKETIGEIGLKYHQEVCASGFQDYFHNEWLYDLVWYENNDDRFLKNVSLVMESEWSIKSIDIKYDFEKLIQARAELRLMIFQENVDSNFEMMVRGIESYKYSLSGDKYLLAGLVRSKQEFVFLEYEKK